MHMRHIFRGVLPSLVRTMQRKKYFRSIHCADRAHSESERETEYNTIIEIKRIKYKHYIILFVTLTGCLISSPPFACRKQMERERIQSPNSTFNAYNLVAVLLVHIQHINNVIENEMKIEYWWFSYKKRSTIPNERMTMIKFITFLHGSLFFRRRHRCFDAIKWNAESKKCHTKSLVYGNRSEYQSQIMSINLLVEWTSKASTDIEITATSGCNVQRWWRLESK